MPGILDTLKSVLTGGTADLSPEALAQVVRTPKLGDSPFLVGAGASVPEALFAALASQPSSSQLAMIPTKKNLPVFLKRLSDILGKPASQATAEEYGRAFMQTRYPMRMREIQPTRDGKVAQTFYEQPKFQGTNVGGRHDPVRDPRTGKLIGHEIEYANRFHPEYRPDDVVNSLAHETQHAVQHRRVPEWVMDLDAHLPYANRWKEFGQFGTGAGGAMMAGETAERAFMQFLGLLP